MIAFGPSTAMLGITIAKDPIRIIILISAYVLLILSIMSAHSMIHYDFINFIIVKKVI